MKIIKIILIPVFILSIFAIFNLTGKSDVLATTCSNTTNDGQFVWNCPGACSSQFLNQCQCEQGGSLWSCQAGQTCGALKECLGSKTEPSFVPAVIGTIPPPPGIDKYEKSGGFGGFLSNVIILFTVIAGIVAFYNLLIGGFQFITSAGNPKGIEEAWKKLVFSLIGLIIIVGAFIVANIVGNALGFNLLDLSLIKGPQ